MVLMFCCSWLWQMVFPKEIKPQCFVMKPHCLLIEVNLTQICQCDKLNIQNIRYYFSSGIDPAHHAFSWYLMAACMQCHWLRFVSAVDQSSQESASTILILHFILESHLVHPSIEKLLNLQKKQRDLIKSLDH